MTRYKVISEERQIGANILYYPDSLELAKYGGLFEYYNAQEQNYGLHMKAGYDYTLGSSHNGSMLLGAEYSHFHLYGMHWQLGYDYNFLIPEIPEIRDMCLGHENLANVAFQLKHQWHSLILNAGVRYDHRHHLNSPENVNELSPRVALILLRPRWNMKLSYSKSFVDYPYIYQIGNIFRAYLLNDRATMIYLLEPERIHSLQLSVAGNNRTKSLNLEANLFYNRASNLIVSVYEDYTNSGHNEAIGLELRGSYHKPRFTADVNMTWTHVIKSSLNMPDSHYDDGYQQPWGVDVNNNMPAIIANGVVAWKVTPSLKLHTHLLFESRQSTYFLDLKKEMLVAGYYKLAGEADKKGDKAAAAELRAKADEENRTVSSKGDMPARVIINLGGEYTLGPVTIGLNIHNLFNTSYDRSGLNTNLIPQQGRWLMATVGVKL
jgi:iron complex outermembrane receptor protein